MYVPDILAKEQLRYIIRHNYNLQTLVKSVTYTPPYIATYIHIM